MGFARTIPLILALLASVPAIYLLAVVYTSPAIPVTVSSRKLEIREFNSNSPRRSYIFDMKLAFRTASGEELTWSQQLPYVHFEEALMFFDNYPTGKDMRIYRHKDDILLRRGLPDWRFGVGWVAAGFALTFLFFSFVASSNLSGGWLFRPQRTFALFGLIPLVGGYLLYHTQQGKTAWPRVQVRVEKLAGLPLFEQRAPDLQLDAAARASFQDSQLETIRYSYEGRDYLYPVGTDVTAYVDSSQPTFEKAVNPADPASIADIPGESDEKTIAGKILMAAAGLFILLGLVL